MTIATLISLLPVGMNSTGGDTIDDMRNDWNKDVAGGEAGHPFSEKTFRVVASNSTPTIADPGAASKKTVYTGAALGDAAAAAAAALHYADAVTIFMDSPSGVVSAIWISWTADLIVKSNRLYDARKRLAEVGMDVDKL